MHTSEHEQVSALFSERNKARAIRRGESIVSSRQGEKARRMIDSDGGVDGLGLNRPRDWMG